MFLDIGLFLGGLGFLINIEGFWFGRFRCLGLDFFYDCGIGGFYRFRFKVECFSGGV